MKVLHVMRKHPKFNSTIRYFYSNQIQNHSHEICILVDGNVDNDSIDGNIPVSTLHVKNHKTRRKLIEKMSNFDIVMLHSNYLDSLGMFLIGTVYRNLLKKIVWIEYGTDLYKKYPNNFYGVLLKNIEINFIKNIKASVMIFPPDEKIFRDKYGKKPVTFYAPYISGEKNTLLNLDYNKITMKEKMKENKPIIIQIGHSATKNIKHINSLKSISRFSNENIIIRLPLSYGNEAYREEIIKYAKSIFNNKIEVLIEFLEIEKFYDTLLDVDIAIFDTHRQIALGTIRPLIYLNKKVFISSDSPMYNYFIENKVTIYDTKDLEQYTFQGFTSDVNEFNGKKFRNEMYNSEKQIKLWEDIYDWLDK